MTVILNTWQNQGGLVRAGSWPSTMANGKWSFTFVPGRSSASFGPFEFETVLGFGTTAEIYVGREGSDAVVTVDFGGGNIYTQAAEWNSGIPFAFSFDLAAGLFTLSGLTSGDGTYATYPLGSPVSFPSPASNVLYIGRAWDGTGATTGVVGDILDALTSNNSAASAAASVASTTASGTGSVVTAILELSQNQRGIVPAASVPSQMLSGKWSVSVTTGKASADFGTFEYEAIFQFSATSALFLGRDGSAPYFGVDFGGGDYYHQAASWGAGQTITFSFDLSIGQFTATGLTTGDGTYSTYPLGTPKTFTSGTLNVGSEWNGDSPFSGTIGNVFGSVTSTAIVGSAAGQGSAPVGVGTAGNTITGTGAATLESPTALATDGIIGAQGAGVVPDVIGQGQGGMGWIGTADVTLDAPTGAATGSVAITGTASATLDELVVSTTGDAVTYIAGTGAATLDAPVGAGAAAQSGTLYYAPAGSPYVTREGIVITEYGAHAPLTAEIEAAIRAGKVRMYPDDGPLAVGLATRSTLYARPYLVAPISDKYGVQVSEGGASVALSRLLYNSMLRGDVRSSAPDPGVPPILGTGAGVGAAATASGLGGVLNPVLGTAAAQASAPDGAASGSVVYPYLGVAAGQGSAPVGAGVGAVSSASVLGFSAASVTPHVVVGIGYADGVIISGLVNSSTSGDNRTVIQNAINSAAPGTRLIIPAGNYRVSGNIDVNNANVTVQGANKSATNILFQNPDLGSWRVFNNNHTLRGLRLFSINATARGQAAYDGQQNLLLNGCTGFLGEDLIMEGGKSGGMLADGSSYYRFNRCTVQNVFADAFHNTWNASYGRFDDCRVYNAGDDMMAFVMYSGQRDGAASPHHMEVYRFQGDGNRDGRGISVINAHDIYIEDAYIANTYGAGVIIAHESYANTYPHPNIYNVTMGKSAGGAFRLEACNYSNAQNQGSVHMAGLSGINFSNINLSDFQIYDTSRNRPAGLVSNAVAVVSYGSDVMNATMSNFGFYGTNPNQYGQSSGSISVSRPGWFSGGSSPGAYPFAP